jgi:hypothetical protein
MRCIAFLGLFLVLAGCVLTGCVAPLPDNMRRTAVTPLPDFPVPQAAPAPMPVTPPSVGYGGAPPPVPAGGLGAEAPMRAPPASRMPTISAQPGPPANAATSNTATGQSITVPNGNGTTTIIHADGTIETVPTAK